MKTRMNGNLLGHLAELEITNTHAYTYSMCALTKIHILTNILILRVM